VRSSFQWQQKGLNLFCTCLVTRAIHLGIVADLSIATLIWCLKHFVSRRGMPQKLLSDNEKTFKAAAKFLRVIFKDEAI